MASLLNPIIYIGPIVLGVGLLFAIICMAINLFASGPKTGKPVLRFLVVAIAIGIATFVAGTAIGIAAFCSSASSGNLCGLGGVFGVGPLLSGLCVAAYAFFWLKGPRYAA